jgi:NADH dehydrogenase
VDEQSDSIPHVVIVGGGFGGLLAARKLKRARVRVTLIDRNNHHVFQPLLYQVATAALSPADIAAPIRNVLSRQKNAEVLMAEVSGVDAKNRTILLADRYIHYDYLIIATGARDNYFGHDDWGEHALSLKTLADATAIRRTILTAFENAELETDPDIRKALLTIAIVGGGPTGVELAGAIAELAVQSMARDFRHIDPTSARVVLIEAGPRLLSAFPEGLAAGAARKLEQMGVQVFTGKQVELIDSEGVIVGGERINANTVIWAAGVRAAPAAEWLGAENDKSERQKVDRDLSITGHPEIFVIGDAAAVIQDGKPLPGVAPVAMQQGAYVASVIRARVTGAPPPPSFKYHDQGDLATVGRSFAVYHSGHLKLSGLTGWLFWVVVHILKLISFRNRLMVMVNWIWAYFTFQRGARLIIPDTRSRS